MESAESEADVLRSGFKLGYYSKDDVARWADQQIAAVNEPSLELISLSMNKRVDPHDLINYLGLIGKADDQQQVATEIGFIGLLYTSHRITTEKAIQAIWTLVHEQGITFDQQSCIYCLEDGFSLARDGTYGSMNDVELELCAFLSIHVDDLVSSHPQLFSDINA